MTTTPTGRLIRTDTGRDLVLTRTFRAPIDDVWASVTESDRTARWFGPWEGEGGPGRDIKVQLVFEENKPWCDAHIDACEPPRHLALTTRDDYGTWRLELRLSETAGVTELRLIHHLEPDADISSVGPGWEYYLDMLTAARDDRPHPDFDDYYPAMKQYYSDLA
ncbi:SRPBCC family protein [Nocardia transvalensis]|uniref:SRPBCC family protein n=1 Tax=Nocardia transvalensis TaxID=37333 RepID=UPI00189510F0|nr:SRPBCC family protein [Nocardia transvalensis]MBF6331661.1 SRPBCC family protein [Nocardia transvalensis]